MLQSIARALAVALMAACSALVASTPAHALDMPDPRTVPPEVTLWFAQSQADILARAPGSSAILGNPIVYYHVNPDNTSLLQLYPDTPATAYDPSQGRYCAPYLLDHSAAVTDEYLCVTTTASHSEALTLDEHSEVSLIAIDRETTEYHGQPELLIEHEGALFTEDWSGNAGGRIQALNERGVALLDAPTMSRTEFSHLLLGTKPDSANQRNLAYLALAACATALVVWTAYRRRATQRHTDSPHVVD